MKTLCSVDGCAKLVSRRTWCTAHYKRWRRHGSPTAGSTSRGEAEQFFRDALAYKGADCLLWPYSGDSKGYGQFRFSGKLVPASRKICEEVNGPAPTSDHEAAHSCGTRRCITPSHLSWKTAKENNADKLLHGTDNRGERHPLSKLTERAVHEIRALGGTMTQEAIADRFGVSGTAVHHVLRGHRWGWLEARR